MVVTYTMSSKNWKFRESQGSIADAIEYTVTQNKTGGVQHCACDTIQQRSGLRSSLLHWLKDVFLPQGYPDSVSEDYIHYQMWDTCQAYCSSVAGAVSLHATLGSLGVGQEGTTALAATLTWLTNTGTGMIAAIAFTYCNGSQLDSNNKQWRLFADAINDAAHLIKLATPLLPVPAVFSLSAAAVLYALVGVAGGATRTALTAHQARHNNLADVAAKDGSQETLVNLAALLTSLLLLPMITHSLAITWSVFLSLLCVHLYCNYKAVRAVVVPSLNRPRILLLMHQFLTTKSVPGIRQINALEPLLFGPAFRRKYLLEGWSLELGCSLRYALESCPAATQSRPALQNNFMLLLNRKHKRVFVVLDSKATTEDILLASWTAYFVGHSAAKISSEIDDDQRLREKATEQFPLLLQKMLEQGWDVNKIYLGVGEWRVL